MVWQIVIVFLVSWFALPAILIVSAAIYKVVTKSPKGVIQILDDM